MNQMRKPKHFNKTLLWDYLVRLKFKRMSTRWEKEHRSNLTTKANNFNPDLVTVGDYSYGPIELITHGNDHKLHIGSFVSIGPDVRFMLEVEHPLNHLSTYPFRARLLGGEEPMAKGDIYVESDVWLSGGVTVLSGVRIGQGAVIGAGAVVVKDVPPYSVVGGVPSRVIRYRFEKEVIEFLLTLDYDRLDAETALAHMDELYKPIDKMPLDDIKKLYEWFPKKA